MIRYKLETTDTPPLCIFLIAEISLARSFDAQHSAVMIFQGHNACFWILFLTSVKFGGVCWSLVEGGGGRWIVYGEENNVWRVTGRICRGWKDYR